MDKLTIRKIEHRGEIRIACIFDRFSYAEAVVRQISGRLWSQTCRCWHIPYSPEAWQTLQKLCKDTLEICIEATTVSKGNSNQPNNTNENQFVQKESNSSPSSAALNPIPVILPSSNQKNLVNYKAMLEIKKYSQATIHAYLPFFENYVKHFESEGKSIDAIQHNDIFEYIFCNTRNLSQTQTKQLVCAIKFYYEKILGREKLYFSLGGLHDIKPLAILFDYAEIQELAGPNIHNSGHRLCLWLVFHLGIRADDIVELPKYLGECLQKYPQFSENNKAMLQMLMMAENYQQQTNNNIFLFEKNGRPFEVGEMRQFIWWLVARYKLDAIYQKQFRNMVAQTSMEKTTCEQYERHFMAFVKAMEYKNPAYIRGDQIRFFLHTYGKGRAADSQNAMITALRFYYKHCLKRDFLPSEMPRARIPSLKPQVLSLEEIAAIINAIDNEKQRNLICLIYSAGLRRSEAQNLKLSDIDYSRGVLYIKAAKGKKDRFTLLSPSLANTLKSYLEQYKPRRYVFEGEKPGMPYSYTSMDRALKQAVARAGIRKRVNLHLLRHSFATHVLEDGYDTRYLQQLLGHNSIKTTQQYTHLTNESVLKVRSPFDKLNLTKNKNRPPP